MKEKLELKHLATYLPYGLKFLDREPGHRWARDLRIETIEWCLTDGKPILRPLSDLHKMFPMSTYWDPSIIALNCKREFYKIEYNDFVMLTKNHYDVFGLIDAGLAIDINTLD